MTALPRNRDPRGAGPHEAGDADAGAGTEHDLGGMGRAGSPPPMRCSSFARKCGRDTASAAKSLRIRMSSRPAARRASSVVNVQPELVIVIRSPLTGPATAMAPRSGASFKRLR